MLMNVIDTALPHSSLYSEDCASLSFRSIVLFLIVNFNLTPKVVAVPAPFPRLRLFTRRFDTCSSATDWS